MSGIAAALQHRREKNQGVGSNSQAVKYLNQDFEVLRQRCLETGQLFQDETFQALPSALGFKELGPASYKTRGVTWKRPTVSSVSVRTLKRYMIFPPFRKPLFKVSTNVTETTFHI